MLRGKQMRVAFATLLALVTTAASAADGPWASFLEPLVSRERLPPGRYGIEFRELRSGKLLFSDGAENLLNPASTIKVLTSAAALSKLGPDFRFKTLVSKSGNDLCLIGRGDPSLVDETMWLLVEEARRKGVQKIAGDLIADDSYFPATRDHGIEFEGDGERAFTAPIGALSTNFNSLTIHAEPTEIGQPPRLFLDPELPLFRLRNRARTAPNAVKGDLSASIDRSGDSFVVTVGGKVSARTERMTIYRAVPDPAIYAAALFAEHFRRAGGTIAGKIRGGVCPATAAPLFEFSSKPLSHVVFDLNKFSNNFIAEMILRSIGDKPEPESGLRTMRDWLPAHGIPAPGVVVENGSGLSRKTRISARMIVEILRAASTDLKVAPEFLSSFGIAGIDGTLHRRFVGTPAESRLRAKSGSLSGVISLAGVLQIPDGIEVAFCTLFNAPSKPNWDLQKLEERLILAIFAGKNVLK
ncbi:MAG: D-alanyl-D-alanine carboxypeptidase/D-alanyl-D-alanine-endopeptidase [Pseudomonadota bacterium]